MKLRKVLKVEMRTDSRETILKHKRHDYVRGGYREVVTLRRTTEATPFALLDCGHWREEINCGAVISKARRLECFVCNGLSETAGDL